MKRSVRVVKKAKRPSMQPPAKVVFVESRNRWSNDLNSWVAQFRQTHQTKSLPAFDSLFKKKLPNADNVDWKSGSYFYSRAGKQGLAIRLESVVTELKVAGISQVVETNERSVYPLRTSVEFVSPTAADLVRLIYPSRVMPSSAETKQEASFANLLNRGSSLE